MRTATLKRVYFARYALKLRPKLGPLEQIVFNAAQKKLHEIIEGQKAKTGRVRVIVLKARQLGVSTYTAARFYHRTVNSPGLRCIIIGHERRASSNLQALPRAHARGYQAIDGHQQRRGIVI